MRTALLISVVAASATFTAHAADWLYLTVPGDTLIGIGQTYLRNPLDWPKIQSVNKVAVAKHLPVNSRLKIPVELLKLTPAPVDVVSVNGNVRFKPADASFQPLKAGATLSGGEIVLTGPASTVSYRFADNTRLTQQASSKLRFGRLAGYGKTGMVSTELSLDSGRLEARAGKQLSPAGGFQVRTPVSVAGVRGTDFRLNVADDGKSMRNEVTTGAVAVSAEGAEVNVEAGFGTYTEQGKPPAPPVRLLARPDLSALPQRIMRLPASLTWPADGDARGWRVQLSGEVDFQNVMRDERVASPEVRWHEDLADGDYFLRVRAIDAHGLEGFNADHAFRLDTRPLPPLPLKPALGESLGDADVELVWSPAEGARGYLLQLAPTPEFGQDLIERRLPVSAAIHVTLSSGEWHWRIASLDQQGQPRAFSPHRAFRVQPPPRLPPQVRVEGMQLIASWTGDAAAYRLELSRDERFGDALSSWLVSGLEARLPLPMPGKYWLRVIALNTQNQAGDPSPAAAIEVQYPFRPWWLMPLWMFAP
jgi:hypothetical protein